MKNIKDASIIFLIAFIIASTLYGIHMFRYDFINYGENIIRYDRITNTQCISGATLPDNRYQIIDGLIDPTKTDDAEWEYELIKPCFLDPRISLRN